MERAIGGAYSAVEETAKRLEPIREALMRSTVGDQSLDDEVRQLERRLHELRLRLVGDRRRDRAGDRGPISITRRLNVVVEGTHASTYGPTPTHRESFEIAGDEFAELRRELDRLIGVDLPALEKRLEAAGVPWTPGRGAP